MDQSIMQADPESLASAAAKITYLGPQEKPIRTVIFSTMGGEPPLNVFGEVQHAQRRYRNDVAGNFDHFSVTPVEFHRILIALKDKFAVRGNQRPTFLSFAVIRKENGTFRGAEFHIEQVGAGGFYKAIRNALDTDNEAGRAILSTQERNVLPRE